MDAVAWSIARSVYPVLAGVAVVGVCLNSLLLLTTIFTKTLRSTSNILIGCCAAFDVMHATGYFIQFPILFSDYYIDSFYCSIMQFVPALGRAGGAVCVLCIGVDRMLVLLMAMRYQHTKRLYFLLCHFFTILLFWAWTVYLMFAFWMKKQQICSMPAPFHGDSLGLWTYSVTGVNILSALVYFITWQVVKRKQISKHHKKIFTSIAIVMIVEVTGWFISSILIDLSKIYVVPERRPPFHYIACLFVNSGIAVKAIVYYTICAEYRHAIRSFLGMKKNRVVSSTTSRTSRADDPNQTSISLGAIKYAQNDNSTQTE
ncbi:hypothetical protein PRIPAC_80808 [Pristionchus pacificus]|uniref:G protein-coupled receptor n=1 Tax=Pristionchus pacificus TaxID=54126 RepID=A0A2A6BHC3_PRIPA|nr:hypothetical protein PRIPAC_80808 [Pristionchus pacificus]|eukprot:PDM65211.1 G protein-coupled receptor [Pristionchus pacificus]